MSDKATLSDPHWQMGNHLVLKGSLNPEILGAMFLRLIYMVVHDLSDRPALVKVAPGYCPGQTPPVPCRVYVTVQQSNCGLEMEIPGVSDTLAGGVQGKNYFQNNTNIYFIHHMRSSGPF